MLLIHTCETEQEANEKSRNLQRQGYDTEVRPESNPRMKKPWNVYVSPVSQVFSDKDKKTA